MPDMVRASDLGLARDVLGFEPQYRMPEAVRELAEWYRGRAAPAGERRRAHP
jgi:nucleoside-diphosphate-sugar epimerase